MLNNDFIITLAWPKGKIYSPGGWYDKILGDTTKYRIGHTALVIVNSRTNKLHYFDFGRYHTPVGFGRVRDVETDPNLEIKTIAEIDINSIKNIEEIIHQINQSIGQEGPLFYKTLKNANFIKSFDFSKKKQNEGAIQFGIFSNSSLNCGRFVYSVIKKSNLKRFVIFKIVLYDILLRVPVFKYFPIRFYFNKYRKS